MTALDAALPRLRAALGEEAVSLHEPIDVDGAGLCVTLRPGSADALSDALRVVSEHGLAVLVRGGGSRLDLGNPPRRADAILDMTGVAAIRELDAEEGVLHAEAGAPLSLLRMAALEAGWELPLDPPGDATTLGGTLAAAAVGTSFGHPRDVVLGLEVVLASGARTRCGGRVVKNVTGYDLAKLHTGALGTLGVISAAWLRLRPRPEARVVVEGSVADGAEGLELALAASRRPSTRAAVLLGLRTLRTGSIVMWGPDVDGASMLLHSLVIDFAGEQAAVDADLDWFRERDLKRRAPDGIDRLRWLQRIRVSTAVDAREKKGELRFRVSFLPARLAVVAESLEKAGALMFHPARGLVWARFLCDPARGNDVKTAWDAAKRAAAAGRGHAILESAPAWAKQGIDVFAGDEALLPLMRALKQRYDPGGVLNPGRFAGHL